jgi:peptidoglycan/xylan/chitin deacetylase (PgdA/CDA1 family)
LGAAHSFWWEDLQALASQPNPVPRFRSLPDLDLSPIVRRAPNALHRTAEVIERLPPAQHDAVVEELQLLAPRPAQPFSGRDVEALAAAGFEIGFHTRRHYLLTTLDDVALGNEMVEGRRELEALVGRPITMVAYPHGKADERVAGAARSAGYERAFTSYATPVASTTDAHMIGRVEVLPTASVPEFARMIASTLAREPRDALAQPS